MESKMNDSPEPEDSKVSNDVASGTSIRTHYPWIPVNSDEERLPRVRKISTSSSSSESSSSMSTSELESSSSNNIPAKLENEMKKQQQAKGWDKEPLSILWCLNSFDQSKQEDEALDQSKSRVILYDTIAKTVMAVEKLPNEDDGSSSPKKKKKKKKKKSPRKKRSRRTTYPNDDPCESCESIDSSPTRYKDDKVWTGYKLKSKRSLRLSKDKDDVSGDEKDQ